MGWGVEREEEWSSNVSLLHGTVVPHYNLLLLSAVLVLLFYLKGIPGQLTPLDYMCTCWNLGLYLPLRKGRVFLTHHGSGGQPSTGGCLKVDKVRLPPSTNPGRSTFPQHPLPLSPGGSKYNRILVPQKEFCRCQPCEHHSSLWSFSEEKKFGLPLANQLSFTKGKFKSLALEWNICATVSRASLLQLFNSSILPFSLLELKVKNLCSSWFILILHYLKFRI